MNKRKSGGSNVAVQNEEEQQNRILSLDISDVVPNPDQPRTLFDEEGIESLAESINYGRQMQPIVVWLKDGKHQIIAGERRYRAHKVLGHKKIDAIVRLDVKNENQAFDLAVQSNLQTETFLDLDLEKIVHRYWNDSKSKGHSNEPHSEREVAKKMQISRDKVHVYLTARDVRESLGLGVLRTKSWTSRNLFEVEAIEDNKVRIGLLEMKEQDKISNLREAVKILRKASVEQQLHYVRGEYSLEDLGYVPEGKAISKTEANEQLNPENLKSSHVKQVTETEKWNGMTTNDDDTVEANKGKNKKTDFDLIRDSMKDLLHALNPMTMNTQKDYEEFLVKACKQQDAETIIEFNTQVQTAHLVKALRLFQKVGAHELKNRTRGSEKKKGKKS